MDTPAQSSPPAGELATKTPNRAKKVAAIGTSIAVLLGGYGELRARVATLESVSGPLAVIGQYEKLYNKLTEIDRRDEVQASEIKDRLAAQDKQTSERLTRIETLLERELRNHGRR